MTFELINTKKWVERCATETVYNWLKGTDVDFIYVTHPNVTVENGDVIYDIASLSFFDEDSSKIAFIYAYLNARDEQFSYWTVLRNSEDYSIIEKREVHNANEMVEEIHRWLGFKELERFIAHSS